MNDLEKWAIEDEKEFWKWIRDKDYSFYLQCKKSGIVME